MKRNSVLKESIKNTSLKPLEGLVDKWEIELFNTSFLPNPTDTMKGYATFELLEKEVLLLCVKVIN